MSGWFLQKPLGTPAVSLHISLLSCLKTGSSWTSWTPWTSWSPWQCLWIRPTTPAGEGPRSSPWWLPRWWPQHDARPWHGGRHHLEDPDPEGREYPQPRWIPEEPCSHVPWPENVPPWMEERWVRIRVHRPFLVPFTRFRFCSNLKPSLYFYFSRLQAHTGLTPTRALLWTPSKSTATWRLERPASTPSIPTSPWRTGTSARTSERRSTSGSASPWQVDSRWESQSQNPSDYF